MFEEYEEVAGPATEILLSLSELRRSHVLEWEEGRAGKELVGLLTHRLVVGLASEGEDPSEWVEVTNVRDTAGDLLALADDSLTRKTSRILPSPKKRWTAWQCLWVSGSGLYGAYWLTY